MVLYLCATSSVCLQGDTSSQYTPEPSGQGQLPGVYEDSLDPAGLVDTFIADCVRLLLHRSIQVREIVKEALGTESPISLYRVVISHLAK